MRVQIGHGAGVDGVLDVIVRGRRVGENRVIERERRGVGIAQDVECSAIVGGVVGDREIGQCDVAIANEQTPAESLASIPVRRTTNGHVRGEGAVGQHNDAPVDENRPAQTGATAAEAVDGTVAVVVDSVGNASARTESPTSAEGEGGRPATAEATRAICHTTATAEPTGTAETTNSSSSTAEPAIGSERTAVDSATTTETR